MSDYFDLLERELRAAVQRGVKAPAPARRRVHLGAGTLPALLGAAVALAVIVLAVLLVGHAKRTPPPAAPTPSPAAANAVPTLRQLLDNFGTLRRAQTAADRAWQPVSGGELRVLPRYTRLARRLPGGERVFLVVDQLLAPTLGQAAGTYSLQVRVVYPDGGTRGTSFSQSAQYTVLPFSDPAHGSTGTRSAGALAWTSIVPDGVGAVRWTFTCTQPTSSCLAPITLTVPVRNNVASTRVSDTAACEASGMGCRQPTSVVWYSSSAPGRQVARFAATRRVAAPPFVPAHGVSPRPAYEMLSAHGVAWIHFGESRPAAITELDRLLGVRGAAPRSAGGDCGLGSSITWRLGAGQPALTAYFAHGRLVGYQYGNLGQQLSSGSDTQGPKLGTPRGLTVGDTVEVGQRLYGSAFTVGPAQGGTWKATTATGPIHGYLSGVPLPRATNTFTVVTIDAGHVGCPAQSP